MSVGLDIARQLGPIAIDHDPSSRRVADSFPVVIAFEMVPLETPQWRAASPSVKVVFMGWFPAGQNDSGETVYAKWLMVG
jgi:hypothetical protein